MYLHITQTSSPPPTHGKDTDDHGQFQAKNRTQVLVKLNFTKRKRNTYIISDQLWSKLAISQSLTSTSYRGWSIMSQTRRSLPCSHLELFYFYFIF